MTALIFRLYAEVLGRPALLFRLSGLLLLMLVVLETAFAFSFTPEDFAGFATGEVSGRYVFYVLVLMVAGGWLGTLFAARWHRFALLGESAHGFAAIGFGPREWRFLGRAVVIMFCAALLGILAPTVAAALLAGLGVPPESGAAAAVLLVFSVIPPLWLFARLSLALPAAALGHSFGLAESWRATAGHSARMILVLIAMIAPFILGSLALPPFAAMLEALPAPLAVPLVSLVSNLLTLISVALNAAALSWFYRTLAPGAGAAQT